MCNFPPVWVLIMIVRCTQFWFLLFRCQPHYFKNLCWNVCKCWSASFFKFAIHEFKKYFRSTRFTCFYWSESSSFRFVQVFLNTSSVCDASFAVNAAVEIQLSFFRQSGTMWLPERIQSYIFVWISIECNYEFYIRKIYVHFFPGKTCFLAKFP